MRYLFWLFALTLAFPALPASAQSPLEPDVGGLVRTRADLQRELERYESIAASRQASGSEREEARARAAEIRQRLQYGDLRVGDRILLQVQGEPNLPDTLTVEPGRVVTLPLFGEIPVGGVLRSELTDHMTRELSRFIRDPVVRATGLMRVSVIGAIGSPGFYTMPAQTVLGDALMIAGGPTGQSDLDDVRVDRGQQTLIDEEQVREALRQGLTLDQLHMQAGDQIFVPQSGRLLRNLAIVSSVIGSLSFLFWIIR